MKVKSGYLLLIGIIMLVVGILSSCSEEESIKKSSVSSTLEGTWSFNTASVSAEFDINSNNEVYAGTVTVFSNTFAITKPYVVSDKIILWGDDISLVLSGCTLDGDIPQISGTKMEYSSPTTLIKESFVIHKH
jgi:hypothetical protein